MHAELSFGCASYLVKRPEGNILVDVPRYVPKLVNRIKVGRTASLVAPTRTKERHKPSKSWSRELNGDALPNVALSASKASVCCTLGRPSFRICSLVVLGSMSLGACTDLGLQA